MLAAKFDALFDLVSNWGRWGVDDQRGTLNHLSADGVVAAAALVRDGRSVSLAHDLDTVAGPDNGRPTLHYMTQQSDIAGGEPRVNTDFVGTDFHGKSVTHVDALCHCNFRGSLYNGLDSGQHVDSSGGAVCTIAQLSQGVVGRGVLVDLPRARGVDWLEPGTAVDAAEIEAALTARALTLRPGDVVVVRTGARRRRAALGAWDPTNSSAGLSPDVMSLLHEASVAVLGGDGDSDARPSAVDGVESPIHALALTAMGMPLIDNMNLEDLASRCEDLDRWEFLFCLAPLRIPGGTGSPVNPLAVF